MSSQAVAGADALEMVFLIYHWHLCVLYEAQPIGVFRFGSLLIKLLKIHARTAGLISGMDRRFYMTLPTKRSGPALRKKEDKTNMETSTTEAERDDGKKENAD